MKNIDKVLNAMVYKIVSEYPDGLDTHKITSLLMEQIPGDMIPTITKLITKTFNDMAIIAHTNYNTVQKEFTLDFTVEIDDIMDGEIITLTLQEILMHKVTYRKSLKNSIINSLIYSLVQKNHSDVA